jgi:hypothetical protein
MAVPLASKKRRAIRCAKQVDKKVGKKMNKEGKILTRNPAAIAALCQPCAASAGFAAHR